MPTVHKRPLCYGKKYGPPQAVPVPASTVPPGMLTKMLEKIKAGKQTKVEPTYYDTKLPTISPKLPTPEYAEDLDGYEFEDFVKWYRNNGWSEEDIQKLRRKMARHEAGIAASNAHLDKVLSRYNGKTSTTTKHKPLRTRFKVKSLALQVDPEEEGGEDGGGVVQKS